MIHSFLLIGQSNMAGRGAIDDAEKITNPNIKVLRNGRWQDMFYPVNPDRQFSGRSLAESFADIYSKEHCVEAGLIPCADGGTSLDQWREGGLLYDNAIYQARLAQRTSTIAGVLWHQGEADCSADLYPIYEEKFVAMMKAMRRDLDLYDVPFLCGGLGDFLKDCTMDENLKNYQKVNNVLEDIAAKYPMTGYVSAKGLGSNPDNLHFNTSALMEFGSRYYEVFKTLEDKNKVFTEKNDQDSAIRTAMEAL